jgi:Tfp pilus assembly protein PilO
MARLNDEIGSKPKKGIIDSVFNLDYFTKGELPVNWVVRIIFVAIAILIYIYYTLVGDGRIHQISKKNKELEEIKADYTTRKAELMELSRQSYLADQMARYGIGLSQIPPTKIEVKDKDIIE